jgi:hypothetical protein
MFRPLGQSSPVAVSFRNHLQATDQPAMLVERAHQGMNGRCMTKRVVFETPNQRDFIVPGREVQCHVKRTGEPGKWLRCGVYKGDSPCLALLAFAIYRQKLFRQHRRPATRTRGAYMAERVSVNPH